MSTSTESIPVPGHPWWLEEALAARPTDSECQLLIGSTRADVCVVGGGYTGLWTAITLKRREPSIDVILLEGDIVGAGPSGRNGGFLHGYWEQLPGLVDAFGETRALDLARAGSEAQQAVRDFVSERNEDVWLKESGIMMTATSAAQETKVDAAVTNAGKLGVPEQVSALSLSEVRERCNSSAFGRGTLFHEAGTVQPARLARAMRQAAIDAGVRVHEGSYVRDFSTDGTASIVRTALGQVRCDDIVLATNSALTTHPVGRRYLVNLSSYMILTEPIPERLEELGWTGGEGIRDARMFLHYLRTTNDGRIAFGYGAGPLGFRGGSPERLNFNQQTVANMAGDFRKMFPTLTDVAFTHSWGGPIDMASDHAPVVGTMPGTRMHYGAGLSGHGVNPAWIVAQILVSRVLGTTDKWTSLAINRSSAPGVPPEPFRFIGGKAVRAAIMRLETASDAGERQPVWARVVADVPRKMGIRVGSRR